MSSKERRKELALIREREYAALRAEERRRDALGMYDRIQELTNISEELRDVLHRLAQGEMEE